MQARFEQQSLKTELARVNQELAARGRTDNFYASLATSFERYGTLTERQTAALKASLTRYHDRAAGQPQARPRPIIAAQPIPSGRVQIIGEVLSVKWQESNFSRSYRQCGSYKMLVRSDAGWKVYGTVAAGLGTDGLKGCRVSFSAEITPKEADFGFFSRPTNASRLDQAAQPEASQAVITLRPVDIVCTNKPTFATAPAADFAELLDKPVTVKTVAVSAPAPAAKPAGNLLAMAQALMERQAK